MTTVVSFSGELVSGPLGVQDCDFPSGVQTIDLSLDKTPAPASFYGQKTVSVSIFTALAGIGASGPVTQATVLLLNASSPLQLQVTYDDGSGGDVVALDFVDGPYLKRVPAANFIKLVEVLGSATIEYFAAGLV